MKNLRFPLSLIMLAGVFALIFVGCQRAKPADINLAPAIPVKVDTVGHIDRMPAVITSGTVASGLENRLSFKIGGIIENISAVEGRPVRKGQTLATLALTEINAQVRRAQLAVDKSQRDYDRAKNLQAENVATLAQLQDAETGLQAAQANLEITEFNRQHAKIIAPADGRILRKLAEAGETIGPGMPVIMFASATSNWVIRVGVMDRDIVRMQLGDESEIKFDFWPDLILKGKVSEIGVAANPRTGLFEVEVQIANPPAGLRSGLVAKIAIQPSGEISLPTVPIESVIDANDDLGYVFELDGLDAVNKIQVNIAWIAGDRVVLKDGISAGQTIITTGAPYVQEDSRVQVIR